MDPITRNEQYLNAAVNAANGQAAGDLPEPITREEKYLKGLVDAIENGPLGTMIVNLTVTSASSAVADKTNWEIYEWIINGGTAKIYLTMGNNVYIADISTAVYTEDDPATTNLIVLMPNTYDGAFYIVQTGDVGDDNTGWSLQVVPFPS